VDLEKFDNRDRIIIKTDWENLSPAEVRHLYGNVSFSLFGADRNKRVFDLESANHDAAVSDYFEANRSRISFVAQPVFIGGPTPTLYTFLWLKPSRWQRVKRKVQVCLPGARHRESTSTRSSEPRG